jgi:hypothetical protein
VYGDRRGSFVLFYVYSFTCHSHNVYDCISFSSSMSTTIDSWYDFVKHMQRLCTVSRDLFAEKRTACLQIIININSAQLCDHEGRLNPLSRRRRQHWMLMPHIVRLALVDSNVYWPSDIYWNFNPPGKTSEIDGDMETNNIY